MPKFTMQISAQLDGVSSISVPDDYPWYMRFGCGNCGEKTQKPVVISESDEVEGIRGANVNLKISCKFCGRVSDVRILPTKFKYTAEDSPDWASFLQVECRGNEPIEIGFADDVPLKMEGAEGFEFEEALLEDGEFYSYDEKLNKEASVTEFSMKIVKG